MQLSIINQSSVRIPRAFLAEWLSAIDKYASKKIDPKTYRGRELTIAFLNPAPARALNKRFRDRNYATDVLSFSTDDPAALGELAICPQVIAKQAVEHGLLFREELGYMVLHGFLHLLGYDHEGSKREATRMFELQDALFETLLRKRQLPRRHK